MNFVMANGNRIFFYIYKGLFLSMLTLFLCLNNARYIQIMIFEIFKYI